MFTLEYTLFLNMLHFVYETLIIVKHLKIILDYFNAVINVF